MPSIQNSEFRIQHSLITGAADGIGRALALQLARRGVQVAGIDRDRERGEQTRAELAGLGGDGGFRYADLSDVHAVSQIAADLAGGPPIDLLVHSAGISAVGRFGEVAPEQQARVIAVNLTAPIVLTEALLNAGQIAPGGTIVFLASLSVFTGYPGALGYAASKDGIASYARSLGAALRRQRINVLTVFPGPTRTAHARRYSPDNRRERSRMAPEELAVRIDRAILERRRKLVPGAPNRVFAVLGRFAPRLMEFAMRRTILDKLK